jgi:hypothetical protein
VNSEQQAQIDTLQLRTARIEATAHTVGKNTSVRLPWTAAKVLRDTAEALAEVEAALVALGGPRLEPTKHNLMRLSECVGALHHALDDVVLPAQVDWSG